MESRETSDQALAAMVEDVFAFGKKQIIPAISRKLVATPVEMIPPQSHQISEQVLSESAEPPVAAATPIQRKELKTAAELASMIEGDLSQHPECPKKGFRVTVYGATNWRAMLTITPAAGRLREPQKWRDLTDELAERLRQRYDLAW